jgi:hypothetical protein
MSMAQMLIIDGAIIAGLVALRTMCASLVDVEGLPSPIAARIRRGDRVVPWVGVLALAAVVAGLLIVVVGP